LLQILLLLLLQHQRALPCGTSLLLSSDLIAVHLLHLGVVVRASALKLSEGCLLVLS
jgi:hypothetical protein